MGHFAQGVTSKNLKDLKDLKNLKDLKKVAFLRLNGGIFSVISRHATRKSQSFNSGETK